MDKHKRAVEIALRVLCSVAVKFREPAIQDRRALRALARSDAERAMNLDDLACLVVHRECEILRRYDAEHEYEERSTGVSR